MSAVLTRDPLPDDDARRVVGDLARAGNAAALEQIGAVWASGGHRPAAELAFRESLRLRPRHAPTLYGLGVARFQQGDFAEGARLLAEAQVQDPHNPLVSYALGTAFCLLGDYPRGMRARLAGWNSFREEPMLEGPIWPGHRIVDGDGNPGTLLLYADGGIGDAIMWARYIPLCGPFAHVVLAAPPGLRPLLEGLPGLHAYIDHLPGPQYHCQCPLEFLPLVFGATPQPVAGQVPYLFADPARKARFAQRLAALPGQRVGLVWAGNRLNATDAQRSVTLETLSPLRAVAGLSLVSLQLGDAAEQAATWPSLHDWTNELADWADTAALIDGLDLVISVDTAVAHLAGAMGKKVWLLNSAIPDWRWGATGDGSHWYPSLRQFRQPINGDWTIPVAEMVLALAYL